jgi:hypothetical protein
MAKPTPNRALRQSGILDPVTLESRTLTRLVGEFPDDGSGISLLPEIRASLRLNSEARTRPMTSAVPSLMQQAVTYLNTLGMEIIGPL